tara:strand:+ start:316 stop:1014 length:699 start_codon:yes stop_codon:yes gene_type:complete
MLGLGNSICANHYPGGEWGPTELGSKLIAWYQYNTGVSTTTVSETSGLITRWSDQSGNNNSLTPSASDNADVMPALHADGSVFFQQTNDTLEFTSGLSLGKFAIYGRFKCSNFNDVLLEKSNDGEFIKFQTTTEFRIQPGGGRKDMAIPVSAGLANNTKFTAGFERDASGDFFITANGVSSTTSANTAITNVIVLDRLGQPAQTMNIYELIICDDGLSSAERTEINAYLNAL